MSEASPQVVTPVATEAAELADVLSFMEAHEDRHGAIPEPTYFLSGINEHETVELTEQVHSILKQIVQALARGQSISVLTRDRQITTQQAAELLGVSRPTVVRLIEDGELTAHVPGQVRRKLHLADVLEYRARLRAQRNEFITDSSALYPDGEGDVADLLYRARDSR